MAQRDPFKYFKSSPESIRPAVMLYIRFPLSLLNFLGKLQSCLAGMETCPIWHYWALEIAALGHDVW